MGIMSGFSRPGYPDSGGPPEDNREEKPFTIYLSGYIDLEAYDAEDAKELIKENFSDYVDQLDFEEV